jgi:hypothetical protein
LGVSGIVLTVVLFGIMVLPALAAVPVVDGQFVSGVTPFGASLEALVNPEEQTTSCVFEYGLVNVKENTVPCEPGVLEGSGDQFVAAPITGLTPSSTYHYRVVVENATGTAEGTEEEFTTLTAEAPVVDSQSVSALSTTGATLEAQVNPNYQETTYAFLIATNQALTGASEISGASSLPPVFGDQLASVQASALAPGTTYYYRVIAKNATGSTEGAVQSFTTVGVPLVTAGIAQGITRAGAQLTGATINPVGALVTYSYRYISQAGYEAGLVPNPSDPYLKGSRSQPARELASGYATVAISSVAISELTPGTTYHFALAATNSAGTTFGPDGTFTTLPATPPLASTGSPEGVTQLSGTITGSVDTRGLPSTIQFEFGTVPFAGSLLPASTTPGAGSLVNASIAFTNDLAPGTTYYYRVLATNADGTTYGSERSFTTGSFPPGSGVASVALVSFPGFVLKELAAGQRPSGGSLPAKPSLVNKQRLNKALKACAKKTKKKRAACRREAKRRYH